MIASKTESQLRVDIIEREDELKSLESAWNALLQSGFANHIFISFEWISAWWRAFGLAKKLFVITVTQVQGNIVAIAPLMKTIVIRCGLPVRIISYIYNDNASRTDLIVDKDHGGAVNEIVSLLKAQPDWDMIELPNVWRGSETFRLVVGALKHQGCIYSVKEGLQSLYMEMDSDWDAYYAKKSVRFRKHLRNTENRSSRIKEQRLQCVRNISERRDVVQQLCDISEKSWKAKSNSHLRKYSDDRIFFEDVTRIFGDRQWLKLWLLEIDKQPVAYDYLVQYNNTVYALRSDYDEKYSAYSPGSILHMKIIREYLEQPKRLREYEFCGHNEEYKAKWTTDIKEHGTITVYRRSWYGIFLYLLDYCLLYRCKQLLKKVSLFKKLKKIITRKR